MTDHDTRSAQGPDPDSTGRDEQLLLDYTLGRCRREVAEGVAKRLAGDEDFARRHEALRHTLAALDRLPEADPPEDLVDRTVARIESARRTEELLVREELSRRRAFWPTFSVRELTAVAAVLVLMVSVFVPSLQYARKRGQRSLCASNVGQIGYALQTYASSHDDLLPACYMPTDRWLARGDDRTVASTSAGLFSLVRQEYASPVVFQCPAVGGPSFVVQAGAQDFPAGKFISYSYQHAVGGNVLSRSDPVLASHADRMAILGDDNPLFADGDFHPSKLSDCLSDNHGGIGQNVLFLDGHVSWSSEATVGVRRNNIYLVEGVKEYTGDERPAHRTDSFLLPAYSVARPR
jgi:prepilin-type processing-associated H-X9-DG protein